MTSTQPRLRLPALLHPALALLVVWGFVLLIWVALPAATFEKITHSGRHESWASLGYLILCIGAFVVTALLAASLRPARRRARSSVQELGPVQQGALYRASRVLTTVVVVVGGYVLGSGVMAAGGPLAFGQLVLSGAPWSALTYTYFKPNQLQGFTIWVALLPALAATSKLGQHTSGARLSSRFRLLYWIGLVLSLVLAAAMSDRLIAYEYVIVGWVVSIVARTNLRRPQPPLGRALRMVGIVALVIGVWSASEYGRTFLPQHGPSAEAGASRGTSATGVVGDRFVAYLVSNPNNALYAVDNASERTFPFRSANALFSTVGVDTPVWLGEVGAAEPSRLLEDIYSRDRLTTFSGPGYLFLDAGWGGAVLFGAFGGLIGATFQRLRRGELWALLVYPVLFVGVLDSFRILYWPLSRCLVPVTALFLVARYVRSARATK